MDIVGLIDAVASQGLISSMCHIDVQLSLCRLLSLDVQLRLAEQWGIVGL